MTLQRVLAIVSVMSLLVGAETATVEASATVSRAPALDGSQSAQLHLSLDEAVALFLEQNLDLLISRYEIDSAKGRRITARLFPNPVLFIGTLGEVTQGQALNRTGAVGSQIQQLFQVAGKRGYRIEGSTFAVHSSEAMFEDAVRQLGFAVKDTYMQVQRRGEQLQLAQENRDRFTRILDVNRIRFQKGFLAEVDLMRLRLQRVNFDAQVIELSREVESARRDLRILLGLSPAVELDLTTPLKFHPIRLDLQVLQDLALEARPDLRESRLVQSQREAEFKLARAYRYPDVTAGGGFQVQGPQGPDNQQMAMLNLSVPLPIFDRNQGGLVEAEAAVNAAKANVRKTLLEIQNEVETGYWNVLESSRLVGAYEDGILRDSREILDIVEAAYTRGGITILDLLDAARTEASVERDYFDALYAYERNRFLLEKAVGRTLP